MKKKTKNLKKVNKKELKKIKGGTQRISDRKAQLDRWEKYKAGGFG